MKPSYGVIVGRFQVTDLHDGHMELFRQVRNRHKGNGGVIVFIGVAPAGITQDNPLDFATRKAMIQAKFPDFTVLPLKDTRTDETWSDNLDEKIDEAVGSCLAEVTLYGGRDSFVPHYSGKHTPVELTLPVEVVSIKGTDNRKEFSNNVIESPEFRAGMIYAASHLWPVTLMMVDVAILNYDRSEVLLVQKPGENGKWRFAGGHVEARKGTVETNGRHEALEETDVDLIDQEYIGSAVIDDWRYRQPDRSVMTAFYAGRVSGMATKAGDDVHAAHWFRLDQLTTYQMVTEHMELLMMLHKYLKRFSVRTMSDPKEEAHADTV